MVEGFDVAGLDEVGSVIDAVLEELFEDADMDLGEVFSTDVSFSSAGWAAVCGEIFSVFLFDEVSVFSSGVDGVLDVVCLREKLLDEVFNHGDFCLDFHVGESSDAISAFFGLVPSDFEPVEGLM